MYPGDSGKGGLAKGKQRWVEPSGVLGKPEHPSWVADTQFTVEAQ